MIPWLEKGLGKGMKLRHKACAEFEMSDMNLNVDMCMINVSVGNRVGDGDDGVYTYGLVQHLARLLYHIWVSFAIASHEGMKR